MNQIDPRSALHHPPAPVASSGIFPGLNPDAIWPKWKMQHPPTRHMPPDRLFSFIETPLVSDRYGKRSWARYPGLRTLKHETGLDEESKRQAQDSKSNLFVLAGRWSKQKGVGSIADTMPAQRFGLSLSGPSISTESSSRRSWLASWNFSRVASTPSPSPLLPFHTCSVELILP